MPRKKRAAPISAIFPSVPEFGKERTGQIRRKPFLLTSGRGPGLCRSRNSFPPFLRFYDHSPAAEGKNRFVLPKKEEWNIHSSMAGEFPSSGKEPGRFPSPQEERAAGSFSVCMLPICHFAKR
ncbi:hypothetical protein B4135_2837 [Caldibacillus debilis]|uniref:Uncharacterized protein n=1 Tax=Caldibacillus debilis TaxID=301148 RepID=A0A150LQ85_9BACI|nr:hypothetical protein B4135_2837 [Caldibacillus debilis]